MAHFQPGDRVRVLSTHMATHHRTPDYIKGKVGRVHARSGHYPNPETSAYGGDGLPERDLYLVEFGMGDLWGERSTGPTGDTVLVDIFEHWLEPAEEPAHDGGTA